MKKTLFLFLGVFLLAGAVANAQTAVGGSSGSGSASVSPAIVPGYIGGPVPIVPPVDTGFIEFNDLTVESVSASNPPAEIVASNQDVVMPMSVPPALPPGVESNANGVTPSIGNATPTASAAAPTAQTCYQFATQDSSNGTPIACPTPPVAATSTATTQTQVPAASSMPATGPMIPAPTPTTPPVNIYFPQPYRIEIGNSTELFLRDRTPATLNDFAPGDEINVFGYYNADGSVQAYLVRDISKPAETQSIQLNQVEIVSISGGSVPATIAVTQEQTAPCYAFGANSEKQPFACPLGVPSFSSNAATQNVATPAALAPDWAMLRKYVVNVDGETIFLDNNRNQLQLADLHVGDILNVYGETDDNGQTLTADIVRDLSIPPSPSTYSGTVTQVNADGSFVVQTNDGQTITVPNPIQVGENIQLTGLLDQLKNILSQITNITIGNNFPLPAVQAGQ